MSVFSDIVNYIRSYKNLKDIDVHGRYVVEKYDDGTGREVTIEVFDEEAQVVHRPTLKPVYRDEDTK